MIKIPEMPEDYSIGCPFCGEWDHFELVYEAGYLWLCINCTSCGNYVMGISFRGRTEQYPQLPTAPQRREPWN